MKKNLKKWALVLALAGSSVGMFAAEGVQLDSSWLDRAEYDPESRILTIRMKNSSDLYEFRDVPEETFREFLSAESKGTYFAKKIQNQYPTLRR